MNVLLTGAGGYLGAGLVSVLEKHHRLRLYGLSRMETAHERFSGDIRDLDAIRKAMKGMDAFVLNHMAPNKPGVYDTPTEPFDVNVKGAAYLFAAAAECGVKRAVVISSTGVVNGHMQDKAFLTVDMPPKPTNLYGVTKACQEVIAEWYHRQHGIRVAMLRPAYVNDADHLVDKYGKKRPSVNWQFIDRRDIGTATLRALELPDLGCEVFYLLGHRDCVNHADMKPSFERLGWKPKHDFSQYPDDAPPPPEPKKT
jgi:nucleoside-diphosphate-sugar epimerase